MPGGGGEATELCLKKPINIMSRPRLTGRASGWLLIKGRTLLRMSGVTGSLVLDCCLMVMATARRANCTL